MSPLRMRFVHEYLKDLNGTQAVIRAGFKVSTPESAATEASRLLRNAEVKRAIDSGVAQRAVRVEAKADDVVRELLRLATIDVMKAFDSKGRFLPLQRMPEDVRRAIQSVEVEELFEGSGENKVQIGFLRKVKFWDKKGALELLGKHLRMFDERKPGSGDGVQTSALDAKTALKILQLASRVREAPPSEDTEH